MSTVVDKRLRPSTRVCARPRTNTHHATDADRRRRTRCKWALNKIPKQCRYLVEVDRLHQPSPAKIGELQKVLPLFLDAVDATLDLLGSKIVGLDEVVSDLQHCRKMRVTRVQFILVRLRQTQITYNRATGKI